MRKRLMVILIVMTMVFAGCSSSNETEESDKSTEEESTNNAEEDEDTTEKIYVNDFDPKTNQVITYDGIEFQVPADWEMAEGVDNSITFDFINGRLTVMSIDNPIPGYDMNTEEQQKAYLASLDDDDSYKEISQNIITVLDGIPALYVTYTRDYANGPMNVTDVGIATDDKFYGFTGADFQDSEYDHSKDFEQVINSLTWSEGDTAEWGNNELVKHIAEYKFQGVEQSDETGENIIFWDVHFDEDCDTNRYDDTDFKEVIKACLNQPESKGNEYQGCGIQAYNSDDQLSFSWLSYSFPDTITQYDWRSVTNEHPSPKQYEWKMAQEEINELLNSGK